MPPWTASPRHTHRSTRLLQRVAASAPSMATTAAVPRLPVGALMLSGYLPTSLGSALPWKLVSVALWIQTPCGPGLAPAALSRLCPPIRLPTLVHTERCSRLPSAWDQLCPRQPSQRLHHPHPLQWILSLVLGMGPLPSLFFPIFSHPLGITYIFKVILLS